MGLTTRCYWDDFWEERCAECGNILTYLEYCYYQKKGKYICEKCYMKVNGVPVLPGDMGAVTLSAAVSEKLTASWAEVEWAAEYEVYCGTSTSMPSKPAQTVSGTSATVTGLTNGTTYYVWVKPKNINGTGAASAMVSGVVAKGVATLAGGYQGYAETAARFYKPSGVAVDSAGNVYVADSHNNRIQKISASGEVTTLAGSSTYGYADGTGTAAQFKYPSGVAVDSAGNVYVADAYNHRIRKISASGEVTTLAGSAYGYADGTGTAAQFYYPLGVAVDSAGNIYVADSSNHRIRKINPGGMVATLAGSGAEGYADGTGTAAQFKYPSGVAVDSAGNVYVADSHNYRIRKINPNGVVTTLAGNGNLGYADGTGTAAEFNQPGGVAVDSAGNVYVADSHNNRIRKISPNGVVTTLAGSGAWGYADDTGTAARFKYPHGVEVDSAGNVYVADTGNQRIRKITL